jgi:hypothetical protein
MVQPSQLVPLQLALRLLMPDPMIGERVQFSLGELPDELPIELPLPDQSQVVASLQQEQVAFTILIQVPQPSLLIQSWYSNRLRALGWLQWQSDEEPIGLINFHLLGDPAPGQRNAPVSYLTFCYRPQSLTLTLRFRSATNNSTHVKLKLSNNRVLPSLHQEEWEGNMLNWLPIPQLVPPSGMRILRGRHLSGSEKALRSEARIQTSLSSDLLLNHYSTQLAQSGWTQQAGEEQDGLWWSIWKLQDQQDQMWQLLLSFVADENHVDQFTASLRILNVNDFEQVMPPTSVPIPSTESIPEDILRQLVSEDYFPDIETQQLWIGQLPPRLPASLEFPEQTQVLGSLAEEENKIELFLTASLPLNQIYEHLTEQLFKLGLREFSNLSDYENLGFTLSRKRRWEQTTFIHPCDQTECWLTFNAIALNSTDIRIAWLLPFKEINNLPVENAPSTSRKLGNEALLPIVVLPEQANNLFVEDAPSTPQKPWSETPFPKLSVPEQTEVISRELKYTNENYTFTVYIITSLPAAVLTAHYQTEMQRTGWQQLVTSQNGNCYLSLWSFTTEQGRVWQGILNLLARPGRQDQYTGYLEIKPLTPIELNS